MTRVRSFGRGVSLLATLACACAPDTTSTPDRAPRLPLCAWYDVSFEARGDTHFFVVPPTDRTPAAVRRVVMVESVRAADLEVAVFSPLRERVGATSTGPAPDLLLMDGLPAFDERSLVQVRHMGTAPLLQRLPYRVRVCDRPAYDGEEWEPNDRVEQAGALLASQPVFGTFSHEADADTFRLPDQGTLDVEVRVEGPAGVDVRMELLREDQSVAREIDRLRAGRGEQVRLRAAERQEEGIEYVRLTTDDRRGGVRVWQLQVQLVETPLRGGGGHGRRARARGLDDPERDPTVDEPTVMGEPWGEDDAPQ
jgi:hypothetical protein